MVEPVTADRWDDLVSLFERPGPRGGTPMTAGCWCMWWRQRTGDAEQNKSNMKQLLDRDTPPGLLAYRDGSPVGWVSIAPRESFGQLMRSPRYRPSDDQPGVFVIVCFYVRPAAKRHGVASGLLDAALVYARSEGASAVEAYPNERADYMGDRAAFERRGFRPVRNAGKRTVMRITLDGLVERRIGQPTVDGRRRHRGQGQGSPTSRPTSPLSTS